MLIKFPHLVQADIYPLKVAIAKHAGAVIILIKLQLIIALNEKVIYHQVLVPNYCG